MVTDHSGTNTTLLTKTTKRHLLVYNGRRAIDRPGPVPPQRCRYIYVYVSTCRSRSGSNPCSLTALSPAVTQNCDALVLMHSTGSSCRQRSWLLISSRPRPGKKVPGMTAQDEEMRLQLDLPTACSRNPALRIDMYGLIVCTSACRVQVLKSDQRRVRIEAPRGDLLPNFFELQSTFCADIASR